MCVCVCVCVWLGQLQSTCANVYVNTAVQQSTTKVSVVACQIPLHCSEWILGTKTLSEPFR